MTRYFDASALVKRYVTESGSVTVRRLMREPVATSRLSEVEIASALTRLWREGSMTISELDRSLEMLSKDFKAFWVVELRPDVLGTARSLLRRHPLRAGNSIQLASCLFLARELSDSIPMVAFDNRLIEAAAAEGLPIGTSRSGTGRPARTS